MPQNIILWFLIPALAFFWCALNLDTARLIRRSDRANPEQKRWQIALTWMIPFFFLLPRWMHRGYLAEESQSQLALNLQSWDNQYAYGPSYSGDGGLSFSAGGGDCGVG